MNRSLSLLRPLGSRSFVASRLARPTALHPSFTKLTLRAYATKSEIAAEEIAKANHHVDNQNATSSAKEEVRNFLMRSAFGACVEGDLADLQIKGAARDVASMIGGGGQYQSLGMETSSHGHGGSITEDFVSLNLILCLPPRGSGRADK